MDKTVQPDKKLIVDAPAIWNKSKVGLMTTPPPMPQIAPAVDAKKLTRNAKSVMLMASSSHYFLIYHS